MDLNQNLLTAELQIDAASHTHLRETAKWAKFLGIIGFVISILLVVAALFAGTFMAKMSDPTGAGAAVMGAGALAGVYIIIAVIYFMMSLYLYRFATRMKTALDSSDQDSLSNSFHNLKIVYRILGIIMIIYIGIIALGLLIGIGAAAMN